MTFDSNARASARPDRELAATLHVLAAPVLQGRVEDYIDISGRGIDFGALLEEPWSSSERAMIEIACTIWGRTDIVDASLSPILFTLDDANFACVIEASRIRRGDAC